MVFQGSSKTSVYDVLSSPGENGHTFMVFSNLTKAAPSWSISGLSSKVKTLWLVNSPLEEATCPSSGTSSVMMLKV